MDAHPDDILTADEVAQLLNVRPSWVKEYARRGIIPKRQLGRYSRFKRGEVLEWFEEQTAGPTWAKRKPRKPAARQ